MYWYVPFDVSWKSVERDDEEVGFGVLSLGWIANATEPRRWAIDAGGAYGFWKMRPWMRPWAAVYVVQIGVGMLVRNLLDPHGAGWLAVRRLRRCS